MPPSEFWSLPATQALALMAFASRFERQAWASTASATRASQADADTWQSIMDDLLD